MPNQCSASPILWALSSLAAALLAGCGGQPTNYNMNGQQMTMPSGTTTGAASVGDANTLAQMIVSSNNSAMAQFDQVKASQQQQLAASQQALAQLEALSNQQGSGQITLFFGTGSAQLNNEQTQRLIRFLDYISVKAQGRTVILVSIGGASADGSAAVNHQLSIERSQAPLSIIEQYLVNTPHRFYKVSGVGDMYAPKDAPQQVDLRYQNVRIVAAYSEQGLQSQGVTP